MSLLSLCKPAKFGLALLISCSALLAGASAQAESVLRRGIVGEPNAFDPAKASLWHEYYLMKDIFEGLVSYDSTGKIVPGVAESWSTSPDDTVYTFKLRPDAKWSDGTAVTAHDFVYSLRRELDPATAAMDPRLQFPIKNARAINKGEMPADQLGVRAIDDHNLEITLERPTPYYINLAAHGTALPVNRANIEKDGSKFARPGTLVSNGPFKLVEHVSNDHITLAKNEAYWDAKNVKLDKVIFTPLVDQAASVRRFEAREIDMITGFPAAELGRLRKAFGDEVRVSPSLTVEYYVFDTRQPPFDDIRLRRALSMVIDRDFLAKEIFYDSAKPSYSMMAPGIPAYGAPSKVDFADLSMIDREDMALELMKEAGYGPGGKPLDITIRYSTSATNEQAATAIASMWKEAFGFNVTLHNLDLASHYGYLQQGGEFQVARASRTPEYADAEATLSLDLSSQKTYNYGRYNNPEYDALLARSYTEADPSVRSATLHKAESLLMHDQVIMPLLNIGNLWMVASKVEGFHDNALNEHPSKYLSVSE
ncbi:oligopeptide transport system substrate-binding protein [Aminobacter niigataensis]|uniref:Oligopeptide transport system substrate-binding protein n=1 Tax=Aminobacter niigataensis TaxID=83265 RepID=A0ABR6L2G3_9HYPH|nr:peptide ABC transporter substrate-binding protein [Aminobacter niigataensis]MBB4650989.1 oligopeptide transport system substrate-binding protein [Aminobacter niigataensis]